MTAQYQENPSTEETDTSLVRSWSLLEWYKHRPPRNNPHHESSVQHSGDIYLQGIVEIATIANQETLASLSREFAAAATIYIRRMSHGSMHIGQIRRTQKSWCDYLHLFRAGTIIAICKALRSHEASFLRAGSRQNDVHITRPPKTIEAVTTIHLCIEILQEGCVIFSGMRPYQKALQSIVYHTGREGRNAGQGHAFTGVEPFQMMDPMKGVELSTTLDQGLYEQALDIICCANPLPPKADYIAAGSVPVLLQEFDFESEEERQLYHLA